MSMLIYLVTCKTTGLRYVGQIHGKQQTVAGRWSEHCAPPPCKSNYRLERAIREHGAENFSTCIIDKADDRATLNFKERFHIALQDSHVNGYNGNTGGTSFSNQWSVERRRRASIDRKGRLPWNTGLKTGPQPSDVVAARALRMIGHDVTQY